mgnify:CR=1 FL=1
MIIKMKRFLSLSLAMLLALPLLSQSLIAHPWQGKRVAYFGDSTYRGSINKALDYVKRLFPTKQIVLLTPIHRAEFYASEKNWQPREDYTNKCGEYIDAYVESVKQAGNLWAVPVIDLNALCGLYPLMDEYASYFKSAENDRLHPNDEGHKRMALTLMYQLLTIPCL